MPSVAADGRPRPAERGDGGGGGRDPRRPPASPGSATASGRPGPRRGRRRVDRRGGGAAHGRAHRGGRDRPAGARREPPAGGPRAQRLRPDVGRRRPRPGHGRRPPRAAVADPRGARAGRRVVRAGRRGVGGRHRPSPRPEAGRVRMGRARSSPLLLERLAATAVRRFVPEFLFEREHDAAWQELADAGDLLLAGSEEGSNHAVIAARTVAECTGDEALLRRWLAGADVPSGLGTDTDFRWLLLGNLARRGLLDRPPSTTRRRPTPPSAGGSRRSRRGPPNPRRRRRPGPGARSSRRTPRGPTTSWWRCCRGSGRRRTSTSCGRT